MSTTQDTTDTNTPTERERAVRVLAAELSDAAGHAFKPQNSTRDRPPEYTLLPTGARANRVLAVGTLMQTGVNTTDNGSEFLYATINDGHDNFDLNASAEYQPTAAQQLRSLEAPELVAVVGKPNHYRVDDTDYVELTPEDIAPVSVEDRKEWLMATAVRTRKRVQDHRAVTADDDSTDVPAERQLDITNAADAYTVDLTHYLDAAVEALENTMNE